MQRLLSSSLMASSARCFFLASAFHPFHSARVSLVHKCPFLRSSERRYYFTSGKRTKKITGRSKRTINQGSFKEGCELHILWWKEKMQLCKKPSAVQLTKRLSYTNVLGLDDSLRNGSLKEGSLNLEVLLFKSKFPREVLLCRVGDFYEAIGFDACILVEHAGLNPFGGLRSDSIPKAGCPVMNLRQTLDDLTCHGFSVCIVEEVQGPTNSRSRKERFISGHAYPGCPYVFGLAGADHDVEFPDPMPVVGISRSAKGYSLVSVLETMKTYSVEEGLTEEAIVTKLRIYQYHHLYLHTSLKHNLSGTSHWKEFGEGGLLWGECSARSFEWFSGCHIEDLISKVREIYGLGEQTVFRNVAISSDERPQPLYLGAATQIGVIPTEGIPSLLKVLLPSNCAGLPALYIRDLLLNPPPYKIASIIQEAAMLMNNVTCSIPEFTCIPAAKIVKLLESKEVNHIEFCRIKNVVDEIIQMDKNPDLSCILHMLFEPTALATGLRIEVGSLVDECGHTSKRIGEVISHAGESDQGISSYEFIPDEFFDEMESSWKGRVKRVHAAEEFLEVDRAAGGLHAAVLEDFVPIISRIKSLVSALGGPKGEICYAKEHASVWFKGRRFVPTVWANTPGEEQIKLLKPAIDSKSRKVGEEWFTTTKVENALSRYHDACDKAKNKVLELLRALSSELQAKTHVLVFSSVLLVISKALFSHVSEGRRRGWAFPQKSDSSMSKDSGTRVGKRMDLLGLFPYWIDSNFDNAVVNEVKMRSFFLLTGPNGGGKSSMLRAICAAALLGTCGLMVPAESALIPYFDSIMLHMKAYDSPADGKSSFQMEMSEIRSLVSRATDRSLVLIDEICRGTETAKGTCIAGSIVEMLDRIGCLGVISTHLLGIFDLPLVTKNTAQMAMGIEVVDGQLRPTWKLIDGICSESLAFQTALNEGIPMEIIERAEELYHAMNGDGKLTAASNLKISAPEPSTEASTNDFSDLSDSSKNLASPSDSAELHLREVKRAMTLICQQKLVELQKRLSISKLCNVACVSVGIREQPPPSTVGTSCVYILLRPDKHLYVGQTDDLAGRLRAHRSEHKFQDATSLYLVVPGKSIACQLETLLINQLPSKGFKLVNKADGSHRNFGTSPVDAADAAQYKKKVSTDTDLAFVMGRS